MKNQENYLRKIAEYQFFKEMILENPTGILSLVSDTFNLFDVITEFLPRLKDEIMSRDGKLVIRPDSGDPVDILCGLNTGKYEGQFKNEDSFAEFFEIGGRNVNNYRKEEYKGVIELLWDIFGGTINEQGYKVLDPHIGAIYGDSITVDRQIQIYERLAAKGFAATNIVLGVGSFTYQMNTRDTFGFAAKGAWFEVEEYVVVSDHENGSSGLHKTGYDIYKDPITDDGTKKSLKGRCAVHIDLNSEYYVQTQCTPEEEAGGILQTIYKDGQFYNQTTLTEVRKRIDLLV